MKHLELFAGIGGFRRAMDLLTKDNVMEFHCVGYSEIDIKAELTYRANYNIDENEFVLGDIVAFTGNKKNIKSLPKFDLLTGGFPCQTFSMMGSQAGFEEDRGQMFFRIMDILAIKKPKYVFFRTTFHPDSDYSTFVGAYKPTMEKPIDKIYAKGELISKLTEMKEGGVTYSSQKFGAKYWRSLKQLNLSDKKDILQACGMSDNYTVEFDKGMAVGEEYLACSNESRIIYSFVPQAFLNAYIQAYKKSEEKVYLIIEEINRGNCAQIFGDLFQLLDRDVNGKSEYGIKADADLRAFLEEKLGEDNQGIKDGELCLPSNLYIYATMNTSDQSLFPIDSAFKRRWDWEYEPIKYKNTGWKIVIDGTVYSWVSFQRIVNEKILRANSSEDKMLGDYFVNPSDGIITDKVLLNKILFYLWNDVCKDGEGDIFKVGETEDISFSELYGENGTKTLKKMMSYLGVTDPNGNKVTIENDAENTEL